MSTTDTIRAAFESAYLSANGFHTKAELANEWKDGMLSSHMFRADYQAATEAAKATGTAGEPEFKCTVREGKLVNTPRGLEVIGERIYEVPAARQPAPVVAVKTWQERQQEHFAAEMFSMKDDADFMELEIADLRAALAATAAPVLTVSLTTDQKRELLKCLNGGVEMGWIEQNNALEISSSILAGAQDPKVELTDDQKLRLRACIETGVAFEIVTRGDADAILAATNRSQP